MIVRQEDMVTIQLVGKRFTGSHFVDTRNTHTQKGPSTVPWGSRIVQKSGKANDIQGRGGGLSQVSSQGGLPRGSRLQWRPAG